MLGSGQKLQRTWQVAKAEAASEIGDRLCSGRLATG